MKQVAAGNQAVDKIKSIFLLGVSSNFTTLFGLVLVWIVLAKNEWVSGFWDTALTTLSFAPIFMSDAINHYVLGRLKLEHYKGWDDIQVTSRGRSRTSQNFHVFRIASIVPAYLLAGIFIASLGARDETVRTMKLAFLAAFILHFFRSTWFLQSCIAPRLPNYGGKRLMWRTFLIATIFFIWFLYLWAYADYPFTKTAIFVSGIFYFFLNGFLHPLPTVYSLLKPGKISRKDAFFSVEVLDDDQLGALDNYANIAAVANNCIAETGFAKNLNIRLPLIELPLFRSWGIVLADAERKNFLLVLDSEVKKGVHRCMIAFSQEKIFITTDFGSPQAKFPEFVIYQTVEKNITAKEMLEKHVELCSQSQIEKTADSICLKLETFVKNMIKFLETDSLAKRGKLQADVKTEVRPGENENDADKR
ncbi:MAG: hypothetical protein Kow0029_06960 [Candidatus Rifleibacteriota bacterium]